MLQQRIPIQVAGSLVAAVLLAGPAGAADELRLDEIRLPDGFEIDLYAEGVAGARSLSWSESGVLYVGSMRAGKVYAVLDRDGDQRADEVKVIAEGLFMPNGVAARGGDLWVAEVNRIVRFEGIDERLDQPPKPSVVLEGLPSKRHHGWKFIRFGPDGKLYFEVGAPCNVCDEGLPFAAIHRMDPNGENAEPYALGVRHSVGFDWSPSTGELWFTDNGRDMLGDDVPADELNRVTAPGQHFGYPYCHAGEIPDPEFGEQKPCSETVPPARKLGPHVAAIGMRFYTGEQFPSDYRGQIFIAEHGSWNRSQKIGYRVSLVRLNRDQSVTSYEPFAEGWLQGQETWGRPVDVEILPDGSLLVSDDLRGVIYRISYQGSAASADGP